MYFSVPFCFCKKIYSVNKKRKMNHFFKIYVARSVQIFFSKKHGGTQQMNFRQK